MKQIVNGFERILEFEPAFDKRNSDPKKNYGIHGVSLRFVVKGEKGAVQFLMYSGWQLPHVQEEMYQKHGVFNSSCMPADLGYHSLKPMYKGQEPIGSKSYDEWGPAELGDKLLMVPIRKETGTFTPCPYLDNAPCYYDGSGLNADEPYAVLAEKGEEALWEYLENYYKEKFCETAQ